MRQSGARLARAAYIAAVHPAGPLPMITSRSTPLALLISSDMRVVPFVRES